MLLPTGTSHLCQTTLDLFVICTLMQPALLTELLSYHLRCLLHRVALLSMCLLQLSGTA